MVALTNPTIMAMQREPVPGTQGNSPLAGSPLPGMPATSGPPLSQPVNPSPPAAPAATPPPQAAGNEQAQGAAAPSIMQEPEKLQATVDESAEKTKNAPKEAKDEIKRFEFDWDRAWDQMEEKFGSKIKLPDMKSKEERGLFLMDFGFRMMAAAGSNDFFTSLGTAGAGALQNSQAREQRLTENAMQDQRAGQRLGMAAVGQQAGAFQQNLKNMQGELLTTDQGVFRMMPDGTTIPVTGPDGQQLTGDNRRGRGKGQFEFETRLDLMRQAGYSEREAIDIMMGARTPAELRTKATEIAAGIWTSFSSDPNRREVPPGGTERKKFSQWTAQEIRQFIAEQEQWLMESFLPEQQQGQGQPRAPVGALTDPAATVVPGQPGVIRGRGGPVPVAPTATEAPPVQIRSRAEFDRLPLGTPFIDPEGVERIKK